jgi:hypothetical protein
MMTTLSTAAYAAHDVGLATAIGGVLFGRAALQPALHEVTNTAERDRASACAWSRFSWINLAAHGVMAATWLAGRTLLSGREVSGSARTMTRVKDGLVIGSLLTGIASNLLGWRLGKKIEQNKGPAQIEEGMAPKDKRTAALHKTVGVLGNANLIVNVAIVGLTSVLAMEGNKSSRFSVFSRFLP